MEDCCHQAKRLHHKPCHSIVADQRTGESIRFPTGVSPSLLLAVHASPGESRSADFIRSGGGAGGRSCRSLQADPPSAGSKRQQATEKEGNVHDISQPLGVQSPSINHRRGHREPPVVHACSAMSRQRNALSAPADRCTHFLPRCMIGCCARSIGCLDTASQCSTAWRLHSRTAGGGGLGAGRRLRRPRLAGSRLALALAAGRRAAVLRCDESAGLQVLPAPRLVWTSERTPRAQGACNRIIERTDGPAKTPTASQHAQGCFWLVLVRCQCS